MIEENFTRILRTLAVSALGTLTGKQAENSPDPEGQRERFRELGPNKPRAEPVSSPTIQYYKVVTVLG